MTVFSFKSYEIATGLAWQRCRNRGKNGDCDHFVPSKVSQSCYFETLNVVAIGAFFGGLLLCYHNRVSTTHYCFYYKSSPHTAGTSGTDCVGLTIIAYLRHAVRSAR